MCLQVQYFTVFVNNMSLLHPNTLKGFNSNDQEAVTSLCSVPLSVSMGLKKDIKLVVCSCMFAALMEMCKLTLTIHQSAAGAE